MVVNLDNMSSIANIIIAGGTVILAIVAIFGPSIARWWRKPVLCIDVKLSPPHCHLTHFANNNGEVLAICYYFRALVGNTGKTTAKNVEGFAKKLRKKEPNGKYELVKSFTPMNLKWSNLGHMLFPFINPETEKHCDIFHVLRPDDRKEIKTEHYGLVTEAFISGKTIISFDTIVQPNRKGYLQGQGDYKLEVIVAAENAKSVSRTIEISLTGKWSDKEDEMLRENVNFKLS